MKLEGEGTRRHRTSQEWGGSRGSIIGVVRRFVSQSEDNKGESTHVKKEGGNSNM